MVQALVLQQQVQGKAQPVQQQYPLQTAPAGIACVMRYQLLLEMPSVQQPPRQTTSQRQPLRVRVRVQAAALQLPLPAASQALQSRAARCAGS